MNLEIKPLTPAYGGWEKGLVRIIRQLAEQQIASGVLRGYLMNRIQKLITDLGGI